MSHNPHKLKVGDFIRGSWRDEATGKTYYGEGTVKQFSAGLFVEYENGGITPLEYFFHITEIKPANNMTPYKEKATEIVEMFLAELDRLNTYNIVKDAIAKQCAVKYVEGKIEVLDNVIYDAEVLSEFDDTHISAAQEIENWQQVKNEIEKL